MGLRWYKVKLSTIILPFTLFSLAVCIPSSVPSLQLGHHIPSRSSFPTLSQVLLMPMFNSEKSLWAIPGESCLRCWLAHSISQLMLEIHNTWVLVKAYQTKFGRRELAVLSPCSRPSLLDPSLFLSLWRSNPDVNPGLLYGLTQILIVSSPVALAKLWFGWWWWHYAVNG